MSKRRRRPTSSSIVLPWERGGLVASEWLQPRRVQQVFLGLGLLGLFAVARASYDGMDKERSTHLAIDRVHRALTRFRLDNGRCPASLRELLQPGPSGVRYLQDEPLDGWGRPLWVRCPARYDENSFDIVSAGPSGNFLVDDNIQ